jgi:hypothetical protein
LIQRAIQLGARVSQRNTGTAGTRSREEDTDRPAARPPQRDDPQQPAGGGSRPTEET